MTEFFFKYGPESYYYLLLTMVTWWLSKVLSKQSLLTSLLTTLLNLELDIDFDDGCVIYVNGKELKRINMPKGRIKFDTEALERKNEDGPIIVQIPESFLKKGVNVLAVSVHNCGKKSSDLFFDATLNK